MFAGSFQKKSGFLPLLASLAAVSLAGCGGGSGENGFAGGGGSGNVGGGGTGGGTNPTPGNIADSVQLGSVTGTTFTAGTLALGVSSLSAGGSTTVTANLVDGAGNPYQTATDVSFTSVCTGNGQATITTPISTSTGTAIATYTATGCAGTDTITATASPGSTVLSATADVTVQAAVIGSLNFVSATPTNIGIRGFGLTESSAVQFTVLDTQGNPAAGQDVDFELNTTVGDITLAPATATSDANGLVTTFVTSGTVATSVRVTARLSANPGISTQSSSLVISTGIADQDSFSLSAETLNPEAFDIDNQEVELTVLAADRFNNPVPDDTAIFFTTEGGQVTSSCQTTDGRCSVTWRSSNPRPTDGRVTILATAIGEESFTDTDGDNVFDARATDTFDDQPEAFRDDNEDSTFNQGVEEFRDFNSDGIYNAADGLYNGALCPRDASGNGIAGSLCSNDDARNIFVAQSLILVMSGSSAQIDLLDGGSPVTGAVTPGSYTLFVRDFRGQTMPAGTEIELETSNGEIDSNTSITIPSTTSLGNSYPVIISADNTTGDSGTLRITVTTPSGLVSSAFYTVND